MKVYTDHRISLVLMASCFLLALTGCPLFDEDPPKGACETSLININ